MRTPAQFFDGLIDAMLPASAVAAGAFVTATATAANGSTSEFAAFVEATGSPERRTDLGNALAGVNGLPKLSATGTLGPNTAATLSLTKAASNAPTALVIGASQLNAPFLGGVLVPSPDNVVTGLATDALGSFSLAGTWPSGIPSGSEFYFQMWITDVARMFGVSSSNAIEAVAP